VVDKYHALLASVEAQRSVDSEDLDTKLNYHIYNREDELKAPILKKDSRLDISRGRSLRHNTGKARVRNVELLDSRGESVYAVDPEEAVTVRVHLEYLKPVTRSTLSITLRNTEGLDIFQTSTDSGDVPLGSRSPGERVAVDFTCKLPLTHGNYSVNTAVSSPEETSLFLDWVDVAAVFEVAPPSNGAPISGLVDLPTQIEVFDESHERSSKQL
jgi:hypothetical protein